MHQRSAYPTLAHQPISLAVGIVHLCHTERAPRPPPPPPPLTLRSCLAEQKRKLTELLAEGVEDDARLHQLTNNLLLATQGKVRTQTAWARTAPIGGCAHGCTSMLGLTLRAVVRAMVRAVVRGCMQVAKIDDEIESAHSTLVTQRHYLEQMQRQMMQQQQMQQQQMMLQQQQYAPTHGSAPRHAYAYASYACTSRASRHACAPRASLHRDASRASHHRHAPRTPRVTRARRAVLAFPCCSLAALVRSRARCTVARHPPLSPALAARARRTGFCSSR